MDFPSLPPVLLITFIISTGLITTSVITMAISLGTLHWMDVVIDRNYYLNVGLFKVCDYLFVDKCYDFMDAPRINYSLAAITAVRALCITALILYVLALGIISHLVFVKKFVVESMLHGWIILAITIIAAVLAWAGAGHFVSQFGDDTEYSTLLTYSTEYSYTLAILSGVSSFVAGIFAIISVRKLINCQSHQVLN